MAKGKKTSLRSIQATMRDVPSDIEDNEVLQYLQVSDNAEHFAHNSKLAKKRVAKVEEQGAFRRPLKKVKSLRRLVQVSK